MELSQKIRLANKDDLQKIVLFAETIYKKTVKNTSFFEKGKIYLYFDNVNKLKGFVLLRNSNLEELMQINKLNSILFFFVKNKKILHELLYFIFEKEISFSKYFSIHVYSNKDISFLENIGFEKSFYYYFISKDVVKSQKTKVPKYIIVRRAIKKDIDVLVDLQILFEQEEKNISQNIWRIKTDRKLVKKDILWFINKWSVFVLEDTRLNKIFGFVSTFVDNIYLNFELKKTNHISLLYILPEYRKKNFSYVLLNKVFNDVPKSNFGYFSLSVGTRNNIARHIYEKIGFKQLYLNMTISK